MASASGREPSGRDSVAAGSVNNGEDVRVSDGDDVVALAQSRSGSEQADESESEDGGSSGHWMSLSRDVRGAFISDERRRRKPQTPTFPIIEFVHLEPLSCCPEAVKLAPDDCRTARRCSVHRGTQCRLWKVRGPVPGWSDDALRLSSIATVRAAAWLPLCEVYARVLPSLSRGVYHQSTDTHRSLRFVVEANRRDGGAWDTSSSWSSFRVLKDGGELSNARIKAVLKAASSSMQYARKRVDRGYVVVVERLPPQRDPVHVAALTALLRRRSICAVSDYRRKGAEMARSGWGQLHGVIGVGAIGRVRRVVELHKADGASRATRPAVAWGKSQIHLLPTPHQLRYERRVALDSPTRCQHFFWTRSTCGDLCRWHYVVGSATQGVRRYCRRDGTVKRLQAHTNKYWDARKRRREVEDVSEDEDDGIFFDNENSEYEGCYSPLEKNPVQAEELMAMSRSFLENDDGTDALLILAVGFDVSSELRRAITEGVTPSLQAADVGASVRAVLTFAADGGTIKRKPVTAYTACVSYEHCLNGRTDLAPIAYVFSGEKTVDDAFKSEIRNAVVSILRAEFTIPVVAATSIGSTDHDRRTAVPVAIDPEIQVCGKFVCSRGTWCARCG